VGVRKYETNNGTFWRVDAWLSLPSGQFKRVRVRKIPTRELAVALLAKARIDAFEGRYFDRTKPSNLTVEGAWKAYRPVSERDNDTWQSESGRAKHLLRQLGKKVAASLTVKEVDEYRTRRLSETRGGRRRRLRRRWTRKSSS
jgi:hypothetical protein